MSFSRRLLLRVCACAFPAVIVPSVHAIVQIQRSIALPSARPSAVAVADFNKDGLPDLAIASRSDNAIRVLYGKPGGSFSEPLTIATGSRSGPDRLLAIDLTGRGDIGLAVVLHDAGSVLAIKNDGHGNLTVGASIPVGTDPSAMIAAPLDASGVPTIVVADRAANKLLLLRPSDNGLVRVGSASSFADRPIGLAAADFIGEGDVDLAVISASGAAVQILKGDGRLHFSAGPVLPLPARSHATSISAGHVGADNAADLVVTLDTPVDNIALYTRTSDPLAVPKILQSGGGKPSDSVIADIDGDGRPDIVAANSATSTLTILRNTSGGASLFEAPFVARVGSNPGQLALARLGDGQPLVIAVPGEDSVSVLIPVQTVPCLADFDRSGASNANDVFAFVNAWFAHDPRADVDGSSGFGIQDVFVFLHAWFVGCNPG